MGFRYYDDQWFDTEEEFLAYMESKEKRAKREKVNGPDPEKSWNCQCGANLDRDFPNIHSFWCPAYKGN